MSSHHEDDKKKKIRERNKRNWMIFMHSALLREGVDIAAPKGERKPASKSGKKEEKSFAAKMPEIRNRLDNSKRKAEERWNRFAGTSDGGGRGR